MSDPDAIETEVRRYYAGVAVTATGGAAACCDAEADCFGAGLYDTLEGVPDAAALASIGCGNPIAVADLHPGEVVLDLGSGGGIDVLLSARRVGTVRQGVRGRLHRRRCSTSPAATPPRPAPPTSSSWRGASRPFRCPTARSTWSSPTASINLSVDKAAVFAEMHRLLRPGGRIGVSDVVTEDHLTEAERAERGSYVGCIAGALSVAEYRAGLEPRASAEVSIEFTHSVGDGVHAAIVRAVKSAAR